MWFFSNHAHNTRLGKGWSSGRAAFSQKVENSILSDQCWMASETTFSHSEYLVQFVRETRSSGVAFCGKVHEGGTHLVSWEAIGKPVNLGGLKLRSYKITNPCWQNSFDIFPLSLIPSSGGSLRVSMNLTEYLVQFVRVLRSSWEAFCGKELMERRPTLWAEV